MPASVQSAELVWTAFMAIGLLANGLLLWRSVQDERAVRRDDQNGARRIIARTKTGAHGMLTTMQLIGVSVGAIALTQLPGAGTHPVARLAILWGLLLYGLMPAILGLWWHRRQRLLLHYLAAAERAAATGMARHTETMHELRHNTEISETAKQEAAAAHTVAAAVSDEIRNLVAEQHAGQEMRDVAQEQRDVARNARDVARDARDEAGRDG